MKGTAEKKPEKSVKKREMEQRPFKEPTCHDQLPPPIERRQMEMWFEAEMKSHKRHKVLARKIYQSSVSTTP